MATGLEDTTAFTPRFDSTGLIPAIVTDARDGTVLMFAYMNAQSLQLTQETGLAHFWSRSRQSLWKKGETSGELLQVVEILTDCDQDVLLIKVEQSGAANASCHNGYKSCFYRQLDNLDEAAAGASFKLNTVSQPLFDPAVVYKKK